MIPKFRAWDVHNKKMLTESELVIWSGNVYANDYQKIFKRFIEGARGLVGYSVNDKYLMQSTRLLDVNGKDIFDRDIVETTRFCGGSYEDHRGVVKFLEGSWMIDTGEELIPLWSEIEETIVIGTIYEHPELMEK